jgi:DNA-binding response OmpR family regulator
VDDQVDSRLVRSARVNAHHAHSFWAADALPVMSVALKERPDAIVLDVGLPDGMA